MRKLKKMTLKQLDNEYRKIQLKYTKFIFGVMILFDLIAVIFLHGGIDFALNNFVVCFAIWIWALLRNAFDADCKRNYYLEHQLILRVAKS